MDNNQAQLNIEGEQSNQSQSNNPQAIPPATNPQPDQPPVNKSVATQIQEETNNINQGQNLGLSETMQYTQNDKIEEFEDLANKQSEFIKNEQKQFLILGHMEPISSLLIEFENSPNFLKKIKNMQNVHGKRFIRRLRKDGSCFYRGFLFGLARNYLRGTIDFNNGKYAFEEVSTTFRLTCHRSLKKG
jgi:hypothetical protein